MVERASFKFDIFFVLNNFLGKVASNDNDGEHNTLSSSLFECHVFLKCNFMIESPLGLFHVDYKVISSQSISTNYFPWKLQANF